MSEESSKPAVRKGCNEECGPRQGPELRRVTSEHSTCHQAAQLTASKTLARAPAAPAYAPCFVSLPHAVRLTRLLSSFSAMFSLPAASP